MKAIMLMEADVGRALYDPINSRNRHIMTALSRILEYMAADQPLLASGGPAPPAFMEANGCEVFSDDALPETIASAINTWPGDPDLAKCLDAAGERAFQEEFNYERQHAPVLEGSRSLCGDMGGNRA